MQCRVYSKPSALSRWNASLGGWNDDSHLERCCTSINQPISISRQQSWLTMHILHWHGFLVNPGPSATMLALLQVTSTTVRTVRTCQRAHQVNAGCFSQSLVAAVIFNFQKFLMFKTCGSELLNGKHYWCNEQSHRRDILSRLTCFVKSAGGRVQGCKATYCLLADQSCLTSWSLRSLLSR